MADNEGTPTQTIETLPAEAPAHAAAEGSAESPKGGAQADLSVAELREWLRRWVSEATGQPIEQITVDRPMEEFGLASRDAIVVAAAEDAQRSSLSALPRSSGETGCIVDMACL